MLQGLRPTKPTGFRNPVHRACYFGSCLQLRFREAFGLPEPEHYALAFKELGSSCKPGPWLPVGHFPNSEYSVHPYFRLNCPEVEEPPAVAANPWGLDDSWGVQNPPASEGGW